MGHFEVIIDKDSFDNLQSLHSNYNQDRKIKNEAKNSSQNLY